MSDVRIVTVTLNPAVDRVIEAPGFKTGAYVTGHVVAWYPTGRGITISRALAQLEVRSIATGFVGRGELAMFEDHLQRAGRSRVVCQFLVVRARTRDNITVVDPIEDTESHVRDAGFIVQPDDVRRIGSKIAMLAREGSVVCFGGSLPPGLTPGDFAGFVARCRVQGAQVLVDVSDDALGAVADQRLWMGKVSAEQMQHMLDRPLETDSDFLEAAWSLTAHRGGPFEFVLATRGPEGAVLLGPDVALEAKVGVHPGRIVSTVGCGESLIAGLLSVRYRGGDWDEALREGAACASANATGREAGVMDPEDLEEFRAMAIVERLDSGPAPAGAVESGNS